MSKREFEEYIVNIHKFLKDRNAEGIRDVLERASIKNPNLANEFFLKFHGADRTLISLAARLEGSSEVMVAISRAYERNLKLLEEAYRDMRSSIPDYIKLGIDYYINKIDSKGKSPLIYAIENNCQDNVRYLLDGHPERANRMFVDIHSFEKKLPIPIHSAITSSVNTSIIDLLLRNGASIDELSDDDGLNAVHLAAKCGNVSALCSVARFDKDKYLTLSKSVDKLGNNAFHFAAQDLTGKAMEYLIASGVSYRGEDGKPFKNNSGLSPYHLAKSVGNKLAADAIKLEKRFDDPMEAFEFVTEDSEAGEGSLNVEFKGLKIRICRESEISESPEILKKFSGVLKILSESEIISDGTSDAAAGGGAAGGGGGGAAADSVDLLGFDSWWITF